MNQNENTGLTIWSRKATAFVVRSHRHLWGKNNEDPLAYLFIRGLKNQFIRDLYLGWNKFGQERPVKNWGFGNSAGPAEKLRLPAGIVIPSIRDKQLCAVFIHTFGSPFDEKTLMVAGSPDPVVCFGTNKKSIYIINDLMDGLFLFQEKGSAYSVLVLTDPDRLLNPEHQILIKQAGHVSVFLKENVPPPTALAHFDCIPNDACVFYKDITGIINA